MAMHWGFEGLMFSNSLYLNFWVLKYQKQFVHEIWAIFDQKISNFGKEWPTSRNCTKIWNYLIHNTYHNPTIFIHRQQRIFFYRSKDDHYWQVDYKNKLNVLFSKEFLFIYRGMILCTFCFPFCVLFVLMIIVKYFTDVSKRIKIYFSESVGSLRAPTINYDSLTATSLNLTWRRLNNFHDNFKYLVQQRYEDLQNDWNYCNQTKLGKNEVFVENLQPYTKYSVRY